MQIPQYFIYQQQTLNITNLEPKSGMYELKVWGNREKFPHKQMEKSETSTWFNKYKFSDYETAEIRQASIRDLNEIKLSKS
mgnify:CR=1 FL=1